MPKTEYVINLVKSTKIKVCWLDCDKVFPEDIAVTTSAAVEPGAATVPVTATPNTRPILASIEKPRFLQFVDPVTGRETLVEVIDDIAPGATSLTVVPTRLKRAIASGSTADFPPTLGSRSSLNLTTEDDEEEIENLNNQGWRDYEKTSWGMTISAPGHYLPLDAGYNEVRIARELAQKVFLDIELPPPGCDGLYVKGDRYYGAANVTGVPIEVPAKGTLKGNLDFKFCGEVIWERAA